jgi:hypothetical protein
MGAAKRRGTFEDRKTAAMLRDAERERIAAEKRKIEVERIQREHRERTPEQISAEHHERANMAYLMGMYAMAGGFFPYKRGW